MKTDYRHIFCKGNPLFPREVTLCEVAPRDGFQFEKIVLPVAERLAVIHDLAAAGLKHIQAASFVHPRKVPQMGDAEMLVAGLPVNDGVDYSALVLNVRGFERAETAGVRSVEISVSASDAHSRSNTGLVYREARDQVLNCVARAAGAGMHVRGGIQCAFGCALQGPVSLHRVLDTAERLIDAGADAIALSDTTGMADPMAISSMLDKLLPLTGDIPVALHLHDTRGLGLVNVIAALSFGIRCFDTAAGGMGGCPFTPGAAGNIATEDTAYLLSRLGIDTGIDISAVAAVSGRLQEKFGKPFQGRLYRILEKNRLSQT